MIENEKNWQITIEDDWLNKDKKIVIKYKGLLYGIFGDGAIQEKSNEELIEIIGFILNDADSIVRKECNDK